MIKIDKKYFDLLLNLSQTFDVREINLIELLNLFLYMFKNIYFKINLDNYEFKNKKTLLNHLNKSKINQLSYIQTYLTPDGNNLGFEKIIKTIKNRFF